jgi:RimJ/RimL family protein N-acetyltransferase
MTTPLAIRQFQRNLRDYGTLVTLRKAVARPFQRFFETRAYRIYMIDLRAWQPRPPVENLLRYRLIGPDDAEVIGQIETLEDWLQGSIERRLRGGAICLAAAEGGKVAGFNLVSFGRVRVPLIGVERSFGRNSAWSEQITVNPEFRGRGIASELRYRIFTELKSRGVERFYGGALALNTASLKLARKVGFREIVEVRYRKALGLRSRRYARLKT